VSEQRPPIRRTLARQVLVEAGHRCAIPTCRATTTEIAHIDPWAKVREHTFDNLIVLCPTCHARYDKGEIDRQSMLMYKRDLQRASQPVRDAPAGIGAATPTGVVVRVHKASFANDPQTPCYFVNILNRSSRNITVTHVWFETDPPVHVLTRPPGTVAAQSQWETWIEAAALPATSTGPECLARVQLADDTLLSSVPRRSVPSAGYVPTGYREPHGRHASLVHDLRWHVHKGQEVEAQVRRAKLFDVLRLKPDIEAWTLQAHARLRERPDLAQRFLDADPGFRSADPHDQMVDAVGIMSRRVECLQRIVGELEE
jgi:HNH endonuclease